ncbi:MAG TPA: flagellar biosynthesis protein FlhA [Kofleriaceae bacterium]
MKRSHGLGLGEIVVGALAAIVVVLLVVPVPRPVLDALLVLNIGGAVALLAAAVFTRHPLAFASFPVLLVITTLFRVGLEVSATRLVLADADAGEVVRAFGSSVVAQNLVVGLVVFAVITIVQLIVVARGAERVAEVAARFALDALPGKQMAIDADVRAGALDAAGARARRDALTRESQLYGAMDGAMRFVKGDAIAAIVIVLVNLVGGLAIGVGQRGLSAGDAAHVYSLLSVGEGLVAQIPALLVAVASGLLVTRVASTGDRPLADDLPAQLQPRVLVAVAIVLVGLGLAPGLPLAPFAVLGLLAAFGAWLVARRRRAAEAHVALSEADARGPLSLRVSPVRVLEPATLHRILAAARAQVTARTGIPLAPLAIVRDADLAEGEIAVALAGAPVAWLAVPTLADLEARLPAALAAVAPEVIGVDLVGALVERAAADAPLLVREVVPRVVSLPALTDVVRALAREQVPIDDLAAILDALATGAPAGDPAALAEHVRAALRRQISARWAPRGQLAVFTVDAMIEEAVRGAVDRREGRAVLALEPAIAEDIVAACKTALGGGPAVILASGDVRRHLRALLAPELPEVAVLAAHELAPGTNVRTAGRIAV